jgi:hypothetical protein
MFLINGIAIAVEIISFLGMITFIYSTTIKDRKKFLLVQVVFLVIDGAVWLLKNGFSALIQNIVGIARNICIYFNKQTKVLDIVFIVSAVVLGLVVINWREFKFYELLPIMANLEFSIVLLKAKNIKYIKGALIVSSLLWATYALFTGVYVTFAFNMISFITAIISLVLIIKKEKNEKLKENKDEIIE